MYAGWKKRLPDRTDQSRLGPRPPDAAERAARGNDHGENPGDSGDEARVTPESAERAPDGGLVADACGASLARGTAQPPVGGSAMSGPSTDPRDRALVLLDVGGAVPATPTGGFGGVTAPAGRLASWACRWDRLNGTPRLARRPRRRGRPCAFAAWRSSPRRRADRVSARPASRPRSRPGRCPRRRRTSGGPSSRPGLPARRRRSCPRPSA